MSKLQTIDGKITTWGGIWWHPEYCAYSSQTINLAELRKFKGNVRLYIRKNKYFNGGENGRPNYNFCFRDAQASIFWTPEVEDEPERLYTREEVEFIMRGACLDGQKGYDPYDLLIEDYLAEKFTEPEMPDKAVRRI